MATIQVASLTPVPVALEPAGGEVVEGPAGQLDAGRDVIGALAPVARAAVPGRDGDLDVLGDGPGVPLANRCLVVRDQELPARRGLGPGRVGLPARRWRPAEHRGWPP